MAERVLEANETSYEDGIYGWISREHVPTIEEARAVAVKELWGGIEEAAELRLTPVLMRLESEVEAKIKGREFPNWVECTTRASKSDPYWRVERTSG